MSEIKIEAGMVVILRGSTVKMTVEWVNDKRSSCVWFDDKQYLHRQEFLTMLLDPVENRPPSMPPSGSVY
jgi:hypothetical protein